MKLLVLTPLLAAATLALAQTPPPVNHDFDFWVGAWAVTNQATGRLAGHNLIEARHAGRVLVENYTTPGAYTGMSLNAYNEALKRWHQSGKKGSGKKDRKKGVRF